MTEKHVLPLSRSFVLDLRREMTRSVSRIVYVYKEESGEGVTKAEH